MYLPALFSSLVGATSAATRIKLTGGILAENASVGDLWGTLSTENKPVDWGTSTYSIVSDPDGVAVLDGSVNTRLELESALDFDESDRHTVVVRDTPSGPYSPIDKTLILTVLEYVDPSERIRILGTGQSNMGGLISGFNGSVPAALDGTFFWNGSELVEPPNANGVRELLNYVRTASGREVIYADACTSATGSSYFTPGNGGWDDIEANIAGMGGVDIVVVHQGEGDADAAGAVDGKISSYVTNWTTVHAAIETLADKNVPFLNATLGPYSAGIADDDDWEGINKAILMVGAGTRRATSHSIMDATALDEYHYTPASYGLQGKRFGVSIAETLGYGSGLAAWYLSNTATIVDETHTRVTVVHSLGDDFVPTSGITGFEVSADNGSIWLAATGARINGTTIELTHASASLAADRLVRYQYGVDPVMSGAVHDNSPIASPLMPSANQIVTAAGSGELPTPTFITTLGGHSGEFSNSGPFGKLWVNKDLSGFDKIVMISVKVDDGTFANYSELSITPEGQAKILGTVTNFPDATGACGAIAEFDISSQDGMDNAEIFLNFDANTFGNHWVNVWGVPASVGQVDAQRALSSNSVSVETEDGGFILAASCRTSGVSPNTTTWGGDTAGVAKRNDYDNGFGFHQTAADVSETPDDPTTAISATFSGGGTGNQRVLAASYR